MILDVISYSPLQTKSIGRIFSGVLPAHSIVLLDGELGAGKTTFISGAAEGFSLKESLSSPSFTILNIYELKRSKKLVHADFYRLNGIDEILNTGIDDYLYSKNNYIFIEWGSRIKDYLKSGHIEIEFSYILNDHQVFDVDGRDTEKIRSITFRSEDNRWVGKLGTFKKLLIKNRIHIKAAI